MKIAVNELATTVILADGRLKLFPKGTPKDRKEVPSEVAEHPDVVRFAKLGKISLLSAEGASQRELQEGKAAAAKTEEKKTKAPEPKAKVEEKKVEPPPSEPKVEEKKTEEPKVEEKKTEEPKVEETSDDEDDEKSGRKKKKRGGRR